MSGLAFKRAMRLVGEIAGLPDEPKVTVYDLAMALKLYGPAVQTHKDDAPIAVPALPCPTCGAPLGVVGSSGYADEPPWPEVINWAKYRCPACKAYLDWYRVGDNGYRLEF
jgi:hypothetical protein